MDTVYYGIYLNGYPSVNSSIYNNIIRSFRRQRVSFGNMVRLLSFPEGITVDFPAGAANGSTWKINTNLIDIRARKGIGINIFDGKKSLGIYDNVVNMSAPPFASGESLTTNTFQHMGIYCLSCTPEVTIRNNSITGNARTFFTGGRNAPPVSQGGAGEPSGITLRNGGPVVNCNSIDSFVNGISFYGNCGAGLNPSGLQVKGNRIYETNLGMVFRTVVGSTIDPLTNTTVTIYYRDYVGPKFGSPTNDNNNKFLGSNENRDIYNVLNPRAKMLVLRDQASQSVDCQPNSSRLIYVDQSGNGTNLLDEESQSPSSYSNCRYFVRNVPSLDTFNCNGLIGAGRSSIIPQVDSVTIAHAEQVARDTGVGSSGLPATRWLVAKWLYEDLQEFPDALTQSTVLDSFYNSLVGSTYDQIRYAEEAYAAVSDSVVMSDPALSAQALQTLTQATAAISSSSPFESNEQSMLSLYAKVASEGIDSLTSSDRQLIESLAFTCEAIAGTAVHKARTLFKLFRPRVDFSETDECDGGNPGGNNYRLAQQPMAVCRVYPNPASDQVFIHYAFDRQVSSAAFELRDMMGNLVVRTALAADAEFTTLDLSKLPTGLYHYRVVADGTQVSGGKLLKQ